MASEFGGEKDGCSRFADAPLWACEHYGWHISPSSIQNLVKAMRRGFDGLHALVVDKLQLDALAGHLFVFANRRRDRVKILYWDRDGFAVWAKRLEQGTYAMPFDEDGGQVRREITAHELGALLSGIDLSEAKRRKRYERKSAEAA
jgi:transposase